MKVAGPFEDGEYYPFIELEDGVAVLRVIDDSSKLKDIESQILSSISDK